MWEMRRIFEVFDRYETPVDMVATSEVSVSMTIDNTAKITEMFKTIEARVGVTVAIENQLKNVIIDRRRFDQGFIMDVAPMAAVAVGLALRRPGDKLV